LGDPRLAHVQNVPAREAVLAPFPEALPASLIAALGGGARLYRHQREALDHILAGKNVVLATETSSGKSLCFQLPVLAAAMADPAAHALFIFPTNPLANDQEAALQLLLARLPARERPRGPAKLFGGQGVEKEKLAAADPQLVLTNPEMVHLHLLPQHARWQRLWKGLRYIVVDEMHLYRGAFGGHLAMLLRRVRRCAWKYGAKPQVIAATATVGNPRELAEELCATQFELVDQATSPRGGRRTILWQPDDSYLDEAVSLFRGALEAKLQCILFARSRSLVEDLVKKLEEETGKSRVRLGVRAYRGGYKREEREAIEEGLREGKVRGVVTTNALEVGIDIGSLDVCIMAGYPGSLMAMRQQAGRVGRRDRESAIVLVASDNPLDTFLLAHPEQLSAAPSERAVVGRMNRSILRAHIACAAAEFPLPEAELDRLGGALAREVARELTESGEARWQAGALVASGRPHHAVGLRSASTERWSWIAPGGEAIGELDGASVARTAYPGAVYVHQGRTFRVERLDEGSIFLARAPAGASTKVQGERSVRVLEAASRRALAGGAEALLAPVAVEDVYDGYMDFLPKRKPWRREIDPPIRSELRTEGLVLRVPGVEHAGLHAVEHLLAAFGASFVLCDRDDLEGHTQGGELVLFDRHPGGIGFAAAAFQRLEEILARAGDAVDACRCPDGCPSCIHSGRCLRGNAELSREGARAALRLVRGLAAFESRPGRSEVKARRPSRGALRTPAPERTDAFARGDRVEHAAYGEGEVLEVRETGHVVVAFGDGRARKILPAWLQKA
jgi:DEAD/DEAH box helicase domain-containing protein